ncbi:PEP-CTERM sorting domain-containing protein [Aliiglaciecola sp. LCG003]|uniref:PEP-CTERM sorting domain-containing protein n=1 Tax=Aliiglaciecola sp. LCG003 TaxID=3053655 RepID=UPI002572E81A|nr:PEP-CTERM sorting domain-containing protein [Aliiglaciecola sp. LCG003]WJG10042.1 PEP-CTERM sorting domain-containing protein [Aliiglaciecola sp. LCG003]
MQLHWRARWFVRLPLLPLLDGTGNVTSDVIFGSGNTNSSFTGESQNEIELGLRGKLRYNTLGSPENTFNYDGVKTYTFATTDGVAPVTRSVFNIEWSINVDQFGASNNLSDLTYLLEIGYDPGLGTDFFAFGPINVPYADHSIGTNATANGAGVEAAFGDSVGYLISNNNLAQNSWNLGFFEPAGLDPQTEGMYTINLSAFSANGLQASTSSVVMYRQLAQSLLVSCLCLRGSQA